MAASRLSFKTTPLKATERNLSVASNRPRPVDQDQPKWDMDAVKQHMGKEIGEYRHANIELETFALHAWGITAKDVARFKGKRFTFPHKAYVDFKHAKREAAMHTPFHTLVTYLIAETLKLFKGSIEDTTTPALWDYKGTKTIKQEGRKRKPDILVLWDDVSTPLRADSVWAATKFIVELKYSRVNNSAPKVVRAVQSETAVPSTRAGEKRKHQGGDESSQKKHRKDKETLSDKYLQVAAYALETMAATSRFWVIGLTFDRFRVTVCYFDRFYVVRALSFDFEKDPWKLALVMYGLNSSGPREAGYDPCLRAWPSDESTTLEELEGNQARPVEKIIGSHFELPSVTFKSNNFGSKLEDDADAGSEDGDNSSPSDDTSEESDEVSVCESTSSVEETSAKVSQLQPTTSGPVVLRVEGVLRRPDDLVGRGTTVYKVARRLPDGTYEKELTVLKQSWPIAKRRSETDIVREIKRRLPGQAHIHLPEFLFSTTSTAGDLGLPWIGMGLTLTEENHQDRVLRRIGSKYYKPLWEAGGLGEFKKAFIDCIQIHFLAYQMGRVLHRDISESNLMVGESSVGRVLGILNDWDMAKLVEDRSDMLTAAHHRTASMPFLALRRLSDPELGHFYSHELEAFFYVLIWASVHYNLTARTRDATVNHTLVPWTQGVKVNIRDKQTILVPSSESPTIKDIFLQVKPDFKPIIDEWITPLRHCLRDANQKYDTDVKKGVVKEGESLETMNHHLTFKSFLAAMGYNETNVHDWAIIPGILDL